MRRFSIRTIAGMALPAVLAAAVVVPACRRESDPLDQNRAPKTYLTIAPPETSNADYLVHMFWYGEDRDGVVERFIWYRSDTLRTLRPDLEPQQELLDWNPALRKSDYLKGRITYQTDSIFVFTGFDESKGARQKDQAFHIAAIDDGGKIDPNPARMQFRAQVDCQPELQYWLASERIISQPGYDPDKPFRPAPEIRAPYDTIGMFEPFTIRFAEKGFCNPVTGFQWTYGGRTYPGTSTWYELPDTLEEMSVFIPNRHDTIDGRIHSPLASGLFVFQARARDEAGALSEVGTREERVDVIINRDPNTEILYAKNTYIDRSGVERSVIIEDFSGPPDTLPYNSVLEVHYKGWDHPWDILQYTNPPLPIRFQYRYERWGEGLIGGRPRDTTPWLPVIAENTVCGADVDSVSMRVGSFEYSFRARAVDEQRRPDGKPDSIRFFGNFKPTITMISAAVDSTPRFPEDVIFHTIENDTLYIGLDGFRRFRGDTLTADSRTYDPATELFTINYRFFIIGTGHDDPRDPPGSAVKGWRYRIQAEENFSWSKQDEWLYASPTTFPPDSFKQQMRFQLIVPRDPDSPTVRPDPAFVDNQPLWMGRQDLTVTAVDLDGNSAFAPVIRETSPVIVYDENCDIVEVVSKGKLWGTQAKNDANYARYDRYTGWFYIKLAY